MGTRTYAPVTPTSLLNHECPATGAHDANGNLYTGKYPFKKWNSESVKPYWQQIRDARGTPSRDKKHSLGKRTTAELETAISEMATKQAKMEASISAITTDTSTVVSELGASQAGNSFGGRSAKSQRK